MVSVFQMEKKRVNMRKMKLSFIMKRNKMRIKMVLPWKAK